MKEKIFFNLFLHPVEQVPPLPAQPLQGSARVRVAASLTGNLVAVSK